MKKSVILISFVLIISTMVIGISTVRADEPDYHYDKTLPSDGSEDDGDIYSITRRDGSSDGYIEIKAYISEKRVYVTLQNIEKVTLYFNETDIDLESYTSLAGGDIEVIVDNDGSSLDGEFHGVPNPDSVGVETGWSDWNYNDGVFSFTDLETSTTTITLSYEAMIDDMVDILIGFVWPMTFLIFIIVFVAEVMKGLMSDMI